MMTTTNKSNKYKIVVLFNKHQLYCIVLYLHENGKFHTGNVISTGGHPNAGIHVALKQSITKVS